MQSWPFALAQSVIAESASGDHDFFLCGYVRNSNPKNSGWMPLEESCHVNLLVMNLYEQKGGTLTPVTIHATSREGMMRR
jgi:hypothetical protein